MGEVISLDQRRRTHAEHGARSCGSTARTAGRPAVTFAFDLASPWTYLAAERVQRAFPAAVWRPVAADPLRAADWQEVDREAAAARAAELRMPLVWPEGAGAGGLARRVVAWAAAQGQAPAFVLAAGRLAFCGGFDLDDPEILAEAAAAAGLGLDACLEAAAEPGHDAAMIAAGRTLRFQGADRFPAVRVGRLLFCGEERLAEAVAAVHDVDGDRRRAPHGGQAG